MHNIRNNRMYNSSSSGASVVGGGVSGVVGSSSGSYVPNLRPDYLFLNQVLSDTGSQRIPATSGVTCVTFDDQEELLWMGNDRGHVTSYYGLSLSKYTSFHVHAASDVRSQLTGPYGLLSLTKNSLRMSIRRGLTVFDHTSPHMTDMYCMARTDVQNRILIAGQQAEVLDFDLQTVTPVRVTRISDPDADDDTSGCMIIRNHPQFVCCGDAAGKVSSCSLTLLFSSFQLNSIFGMILCISFPFPLTLLTFTFFCQMDAHV